MPFQDSNSIDWPTQRGVPPQKNIFLIVEGFSFGLGSAAVSQTLKIANLPSNIFSREIHVNSWQPIFFRSDFHYRCQGGHEDLKKQALKLPYESRGEGSKQNPTMESHFVDAYVTGIIHFAPQFLEADITTVL